MADHFRSVFDIIGPVMVGPSSSHTAGAVRIGNFARSLYGEQPSRANITFYGSFAHTYQGHGTDVAIIAGLLTFPTFDERIPAAYAHAQESGLSIDIQVSSEPVESPNTVKIVMEGSRGALEVTGVSIGGGAIEITNIQGFPCRLSGDLPAILVVHQDRVGAIAQVTAILTQSQINVAHMEVARHAKGKTAMMIIETDQLVESEIVAACEQLDTVERVVVIDNL